MKKISLRLWRCMYTSLTGIQNIFKSQAILDKALYILHTKALCNIIFFLLTFTNTQNPKSYSPSTRSDVAPGSDVVENRLIVYRGTRRQRQTGARRGTCCIDGKFFFYVNNDGGLSLMIDDGTEQRSEGFSLLHRSSVSGTAVTRLPRG